jgi:hypothetical protein
MNNSPLKIFAIFIMVLLPVSLASANDNPLQQTLNDHYKSRSYTLRMPSPVPSLNQG